MAFDKTISGLTGVCNDITNKIKVDLKAQGKSASGELIDQTKCSVKAVGNKIVLEAVAPDYYKFVDKGVNGTAQGQGSPFSFKGKFANIGAIEAWVNLKGIQASPFAVARSIATKGIKKTDIYTDSVKEATGLVNIELPKTLTVDLTQEILKSI